MEGVHWWLARSQGKSYAWWTQVQRSAFLYLDWEMMTYWAIVGLSHALLYYRESRERELRAAQLETGWSRRSSRRCSSSCTRTSCSTRCTRSRR